MPAIGVGCGLVLRRGGRILLLRRRMPAEAGHWSLVGGKIDFMEPGAAAAAREAREEVGVEPRGLILLGVSEQHIAAEDQHWISLIYLKDDFDGEPRLLEPDKHAEIGWFSPDALPEPLALGARDGMSLLRAARVGLGSTPAGL